MQKLINIYTYIHIYIDLGCVCIQSQQSKGTHTCKTSQSTSNFIRHDPQQKAPHNLNHCSAHVPTLPWGLGHRVSKYPKSLGFRALGPKYYNLNGFWYPKLHCWVLDPSVFVQGQTPRSAKRRSLWMIGAPVPALRHAANVAAEDF